MVIICACFPLDYVETGQYSPSVLSLDSMIRSVNWTSGDKRMSRKSDELLFPDPARDKDKFKRQIAALENIGRLERQRAAAEISRYKKLVKELQQQSDNRAA